MIYYPDRWVVLKIDHLYKVFAQWYGGYLGSDSWQLNSGIVECKLKDIKLEFLGNSGSVYQCYQPNYGLTTYGEYVLKSWQNPKGFYPLATIELLPKDTNWLTMDWQA